MKSSGIEWNGYGGIQRPKTISWHLFRVFKLLSQHHSESTEKAITLLAQMEGTNPSYFLKVTRNNGDDRLKTLMSKSQTQASKGHNAWVIINQNKTHSVQCEEPL